MSKISELLNNIEVLPASPALLPKLADALSRINNANIDEIVDMIMFDSALTAELLHIANSAYFGLDTPVTSVGDAVSEVGSDAVYLLAASISGEKCLRMPPGTGLDGVLLWKHSVTTAFGAQHVARAAGLDGNLLFTAGLLHDLGKVIFARAYGKDYTAMFDPARRDSLSLAEWEKINYGYDHAEVGAALLECWKLPADIVGAIRFHQRLSAAGEYAPPAACICLGNALSHVLEQPAFALDPDNSQLKPALHLVNLTVPDLVAQWKRIRENWEFVRQLCELRK